MLEQQQHINRLSLLEAGERVVVLGVLNVSRGIDRQDWSLKSVIEANNDIANHMANNQPFFVQLAKQIATLEGGG